MADINTTTQRKLAKTAKISTSVAKTIVQFRKREAKIQTLDQLRDLPGIDHGVFEKICKSFKVNQRTAKSIPQYRDTEIPKDKKVNKKTKATNTNKPYSVKSTAVKPQKTTAKTDIGECSTHPVGINKTDCIPTLPVIAVTPEKGVAKQSNLKSYTPCSVRTSLSGGHIVAIYEIVRATQDESDAAGGIQQRNQAISNSDEHAYATMQDNSTKWSTQVITPDSSDYMHRKKVSKHHSSIPNVDKVSSIEKWLQTVKEQQRAAEIRKKNTPIVSTNKLRNEASPLQRHAKANQKMGELKVDRRVRMSPHPNIIVHRHSNAVDSQRRPLTPDIVRITSSRSSKFEQNLSRAASPLPSSRRRHHREERPGQSKTPSTEMRARSTNHRDRRTRERRRHMAGDDRHRHGHKRHKQNKRERMGDLHYKHADHEQTLSEGISCVVL